jgi:hypothetical protein
LSAAVEAVVRAALTYVLSEALAPKVLREVRP